MQQHEAGQATNDDSLDLLWGAEAIGAFLGRSPRQAWEALSKGELPARKINGRWAASRRCLRRFFEGEAQDA